MKKDQFLMIKLDTELFDTFKEYCCKNRTTMSHELRQMIIIKLGDILKSKNDNS